MRLVGACFGFSTLACMEHARLYCTVMYANKPFLCRG
jgi:hypothetical protein